MISICGLKKTNIYILYLLKLTQALRGTEFESHLRLLEIFSFGTCSDYKKEESTLPALSPKMLVKLRQLSIVTLSHQTKKVPYTALLEELSISNVRELEDLIIDTMYAGILEGKLDQAKGFLNVKQAMARDVRMDDVRHMVLKLRALQERMGSLNSALTTGMDSVVQSRMEEENTRSVVAKQVSEMKMEGSKHSNKVKQQQKVNI